MSLDDLVDYFMPEARANRVRSQRVTVRLGRRDMARLKRLAELAGEADLTVVARALILRAAADLDVRRCRVCGCTDAEACDGGCEWVAADLCSECVPHAKRGRK